jgi:hypothetical protein
VSDTDETDTYRIEAPEILSLKLWCDKDPGGPLSAEEIDRHGRQQLEEPESVLQQVAHDTRIALAKIDRELLQRLRAQQAELKQMARRPSGLLTGLTTKETN